MRFSWACSSAGIVEANDREELRVVGLGLRLMEDLEVYDTAECLSSLEGRNS